jgi:hypothetical protein
MNKIVALRSDVLVCGVVVGHNCICLREPGHCGSHVFRDETGTSHLLQTGFCEISFEIPEPVARKAIGDITWTWAE